ncbi:RagB/SusD family nutrient uptake outer membrane protein [Mucilaginibacter phyllosphaerae]|uniref:RagB/SusD family nutrient uptake outer membrane protein n=1 Tax=Mucilaginibacter phyllosphaerae TaxID=1812349 RepID=A0A4Y8AJC2_9SPHI|nr:RagB/SusD family nutrient uptake outer membrane protein [Mucilaginibacter phyllosphaerae]MBB3968261.1 tetratricopeptide (TPR) repeat protein [Mucilaginibacter phyllosphaerae]TEW68732.1 RagB/SusD family nutrient uptake outer membrane protein [Mucilaginibacter phyllosphaerae]GGH00124.1 membrane protein [Mucilaginibacter phyllosphaerae]
MKYRIVLTGILAIALVACKKNFLELPSKTALSTPIYFKSQSDFQQAVNGAYAPLRSLYNNAWAMGELRADNSRYKFNPNDRGTIQAEYIADFTNDANNGIAGGKYVNDYQIIARVNQLLAPIDGVAFDETAKNNMKGQAYFLRAFAYFDLVQYFGKVPLHLKPVGTLGETALPLSSIDSVYNQIIIDAKAAASLLPDKSTQEKGRVTSGTAQTLLGNVYMVLKKWPEAEAAFKSVVTSGQYSLISDYAAVFDPANKNNSESVFEIQYQQGADGYASNFIYQFLPQPISGAEISAVTGVSPENALTIEGYNIPSPDLIAAYEAGDKRKDATIGTVTAGGVAYPYTKKYNHTHAQTGNTNDNWPVYRYAEVLLFLAEALNEQGKSGEAISLLNQVRTRAGLAGTTAGGGADLRQAIINERRVELALENKRWPDLVRTGQAVQVLTAYGARIKANPQAYYFPAGITVAPAAFTNISLLFPIPNSEAALNPYF